MAADGELPLLASFGAAIRRPRPLEGGMVAELFAGNGTDADAVCELGKSRLQDALAMVTISNSGESMGSFNGYIQRPHPLVSGMVAKFFGEDGADADAIAALSLSRFQDMRVTVVVRMVKEPDGKPAAKEKKKGRFSSAAETLWRSLFLGTTDVWHATGTDDELRAWVITQPCCISEQYGQHQGDIVPMHVERIAQGAGRGIKAVYSMIPGCAHHHGLQHQHGESAVGGAEYFDRCRVKFLRLWVWETMKRELQVESMADADPFHVRAWARSRGVERHLPGIYPSSSSTEGEQRADQG